MSLVLVLTLFHVLVSLIAIVAGVSLIDGFIRNTEKPGWTTWFFGSTGLTLVTSFLFPFNGVTPAIVIGVLCVAIFALTWYARYRTRLSGLRRPVFVIGSMTLTFFNCLVLIVQSFQKIPPLHAIAPVGNELAVIVCQGLLLISTLGLGSLAVKRFKL